MNDKEVSRHLESRWNSHTLESNLSFVNSLNESLDNYLFGIFYTETDEHIGNMKLGPIIKQYHSAYIGYLIGEKSFWGRGIITEAIGLICKFGFETLGLHRIEAGAYEAAVGSWKALERNGFVREGIHKEAVLSDGAYMDTYHYALVVADYEKGMGM